MEIQKIFSDQYDEERYYSVLMNEEELALYESMFSDDEEEEPKKKSHRGAKIAAGVTGAGALTAGGVYVVDKTGKYLVKDGNALRREAAELVGKQLNGEKITQADIDKIAGRGAKRIKIGQSMQKPMEYVRRGKDAVVSHAGQGKAAVVSHVGNHAKAYKIGGGLAAGSALAAGTAYGVHKMRKRSKED